jgi:cardiolipin synthase
VTTAAAPAPGRSASRQLLTVPNLITMVRLCCIPLFLYLLFGKEDRAAAAWLLGGLGATDWVDGYVARRFNQVSELGKVLDPVADRLLFIVGIGAIIIDGSAPLLFSILVIVREAGFAVAMLVLTAFGMKRFDVTFVGKAATFALMWAFPLFLMSEADVRLAGWFRFCAWGFGIPGLVLSYYAAFTYLPTIKANLVTGRAERAARRDEAARAAAGVRP